MCNSIAHLLDPSLRDHASALANFRALLKPGGVLDVDHRNYDAILERGRLPEEDSYYRVLWQLNR